MLRFTESASGDLGHTAGNAVVRPLMPCRVLDKDRFALVEEYAVNRAIGSISVGYIDLPQVLTFVKDPVTNAGDISINFHRHKIVTGIEGGIIDGLQIIVKLDID